MHEVFIWDPQSDVEVRVGANIPDKEMAEQLAQFYRDGGCPARVAPANTKPPEK